MVNREEEGHAPPLRGRAVVLGAGPDGLRIARQLSQTYAHVIIIDRGPSSSAASPPSSSPSTASTGRPLRTAGPRLTNVDIMVGYDVVGLIAADRNGTPVVTGVALIRTGGRLRRDVPADLVVDTTGQARRVA